MDITVSVEDEILTVAEKRAGALGTSVNQLMHDYLAELAADSTRADLWEEFVRLSREGEGHSNGRAAMSLAFFDTNILVYADDKDSPEKQSIANSLLFEYGRANRRAVATQRRKIEIHKSDRLVRITEDGTLKAIDIRAAHSLSFRDALTIQAARVSSAEILFTEDMQHGSTIAGIRIRNPFLSANG